ncbi:electron transfer flavoprotein subunit beta/FixA family protein [Glutamicibacter uratoxydans]|uniref:electron transfer flavoprotein subunit beta/FixA family protein n=1 Tax=Glutamicibacter uratoxydans TaxID=43667 RepID=UPI003D6E072A
MKIVVLIKEVPDTYGERKLSLETGLADRAAGDVVMDEIGERAIEVALSYADANADTEVILLSMGPESAQATIRKGLAMGATRAVQVADEKLLGADLLLTSEVLAAALSRLEADLIIAGNQSTDGSGGVLPSMLAERMNLPQLTFLSSVEITADKVSGNRATDAGNATVSAELPAIISVTEALPDGRFPNFKGIMAAKKKPFETLSTADLGVDVERLDIPRVIMTTAAAKPPRSAGVKIVDDGDAGRKLAEFLIENKLV